ncbi:hypothetical protein O0I10_003108 [Lichtheimia ornata]|uniref:Uncharacterized protein n=1 Tax=Lichtheimia ornata TaxID=688661 RepID=A0AAD7Y1H4_9FUNG|nr:uncharacterized protein O0I10_003108 [Lichtheimia ornata]KAJ8661356.1 hypothetical protein O0I10_003108 [Lichtheimia ornata]
MAAVPQQQEDIDRTEEINNVFGGNARNIRGLNRTCDIRSILRPEYQYLRGTFITIAEQHNILSRDAYNLMNMHVRRFMRAIGDYDEEDNWAPNFATINMPGNGIQPGPGGQQVMAGQGLLIPPVTNQVLWTWAYKLVSNNPTLENVDITSQDPAARDLLNTYTNHFQPMQRNAQGNALYEPPAMYPRLLSTLSERFAREAVRNVKNMLWRNIPVYVSRLCDGYIKHMVQSETNFDVYNNLKGLAPIMSTGIINHQANTPPQLAPADEHYFTQFVDVYQEIHQACERLLADVPLVEMQSTPSRGLGPVLAMRLMRFSMWLLLQADGLDTRRWSILPLGKTQVGFFGIDLRMLWAILHYARDQDQDALVPAICLNQHGNVLAKLPFDATLQPPRQKELLWEALFNIDYVQRRRWRYSGELPGTAIRFAHYMRTDGFTANVMFERPQPRNLPPFFPEIAKTARREVANNADLANIHTGIYMLNKAPQGLNQDRLQNSRLVGIDPGKREFITGIHHEETLEVQPGENPPRLSAVEIRSRHYQHATMVHWVYKHTLANRQKANMQEVYDQLAQESPNVPRLNQFKAHVACVSRNSNRLRDFSSHFKHRITRGILFSARQSYQQVMINEILGISPPDSPREQVMFINRTSKAKRRGMRRFRRRDIGWQRPEQETIVAYGDASLGHMRGYAPLPHWEFIKRLCRQALVIFIDEFRTSITCRHDGAELRLCYDNRRLHCNHKKTRNRVQTAQGTRGRKVLHCKDDDGAVIGRSNLCQQRFAVGNNTWRNLIYAVKRCNEHGFLGRDVNAAAQMRSVLRLYMETNGDLQSRPPHLRR